MSKPANFGAYALRRHEARRAAGVVEYLAPNSPEVAEARSLGQQVIDVGYVHSALLPFQEWMQFKVNVAAHASACHLFGENHTKDHHMLEMYNILKHLHKSGTLTELYADPERIVEGCDTAQTLRCLAKALAEVEQGGEQS